MPQPTWTEASCCCAYGQNVEALHHLLEARRQDPLGSNAAEEIALAISREREPFRRIARFVPQWHRSSAGAVFAVSLTILLVYLSATTYLPSPYPEETSLAASLIVFFVASVGLAPLTFHVVAWAATIPNEPEQPLTIRVRALSAGTSLGALTFVLAMTALSAMFPNTLLSCLFFGAMSGFFWKYGVPFHPVRPPTFADRAIFAVMVAPATAIVTGLVLHVVDDRRQRSDWASIATALLLLSMTGCCVIRRLQGRQQLRDNGTPTR